MKYAYGKILISIFKKVFHKKNTRMYMTYPIADASSSVVPSASNISSSFGRLSPVNVADVPEKMMSYM